MLKVFNFSIVHLTDTKNSKKNYTSEAKTEPFPHILKVFDMISFKIKLFVSVKYFVDKPDAFAPIEYSKCFVSYKRSLRSS